MSLAGVCSEVVGDANMLAENVTKDMVCTFCKKTGHSASFFMNGTQFHCPEKASKNDDVKDKSYSNRFTKQANAIYELQETIHSLTSQLQNGAEDVDQSHDNDSDYAAAATTRKPNKRFAKRSNRPNRNHSGSEASASAVDDEDDDKSDDSDGSHVSSFASAVAPRKPTWKSRNGANL